MEQTINRYQSPYRTRTKTTYNEKKIVKYWYKFIRQTIISGGILAVFLCCENVEGISSSSAWDTAIKMVSSDISVEQVKSGVSQGVEYIKTYAPNVFFEETMVDSEELEDKENLDTDESINEEVAEEKVDPTINMTQSEKDIYNILSKTTILRPVNSEITSSFGDRIDPITKKYALHTGTDFGVPVGTQIKSAITGTVVEVKKSNVSFGNFVRVKNADIVTTYAHCSTLKVKEGDKVKQGDIIALSGNTGKSSGPHLHFEVTKDGRYIDPENVMSSAV